MSTLNIITTCTNRKTHAPERAMMLRHFHGHTLKELATSWTRALRQQHDCTVPADQLYSGDHWAIAKSLPTIAEKRGYRAKLWVLSAGYGLIPADAMISPYSATFAMNQPDSILRHGLATDRVPALQQWWRLLGTWGGPSSGEARTLRELSEKDSSAAMLIAASPGYLDAVREDLESSMQILGRRGMLLVISAGTRTAGLLEPVFVPVDARLQSNLGGARQSLNVRMARYVLGLFTPGARDADGIIKNCRRLGDSLPDLVTPCRAKLTDIEVVAFIRRELGHNSGASATTLLRQLRTGNHACEQHRFKALFEATRREMHA